MTMRKLFALLAILCLASCTSYNSRPECYLLSDCNPGKECGQMVPCSDGKCDSTRTFELPCEEPCVTEEDCPEYMHCRRDEGICVADGTCVDVSECRGLAHQDCVGEFECQDGRCRYECLDITSCSLDGDCVLADKECCCGFEVEDYLAVRQDMLLEWIQREECQGVPCPEIACYPPEGLKAVCSDGQCTTDFSTSEDPCSSDSDCVEVPADCCGCEYGGEETAVHKDSQSAYLEELSQMCMLGDYWCPGYDACTTRPAICHQGECTILGEQCGCGDVWSGQWDPVCVQTDGGLMTLVNECQAACLGMDWFYHGNCNCLIDCLVPDPVCAGNGISYVCGVYEITCNGQIPIYPGECDPACDHCAQDGPMPFPVCGEDFWSYGTLCYLDCRNLDYWHSGPCLEGEGQVCGPYGNPCPSDDLFCLTPSGCWECPGQCIALGHCLTPEDCLEQPLTHDACEGIWTCPDDTCIWQCN